MNFIFIITMEYITYYLDRYKFKIYESSTGESSLLRSLSQSGKSRFCEIIGITYKYGTTVSLMCIFSKSAIIEMHHLQKASLQKGKNKTLSSITEYYQNYSQPNLSFPYIIVANVFYSLSEREP